MQRWEICRVTFRVRSVPRKKSLEEHMREWQEWKTIVWNNQKGFWAYCVDIDIGGKEKRRIATSALLTETAKLGLEGWEPVSYQYLVYGDRLEADMGDENQIIFLKRPIKE